MEFEKFKRYITNIQNTYEKEELLSKCIEQHVAKNSFCIVNISDDVISSLVEILADYYDCYFKELNHRDNDISWWLNTEEKTMYFKNDKTGEDEEIHLEDIYAFWKYLEENRNNKIKNGEYNDKARNGKD